MSMFTSPASHCELLTSDQQIVTQSHSTMGFLLLISVRLRDNNNISYLQHNMATAVDKDAIKEAYSEVMADNNGIEW